MSGSSTVHDDARRRREASAASEDPEVSDPQINFLAWLGQSTPPADVPLCSHLLSEANTAITRDRATTYGDAEASFHAIAGIWNWWLEGRLRTQLGPYDVAMLLGLLKDARLRGNPDHRDNYVDALGYRALAGEVYLNGKVPPCT